MKAICVDTWGWVNIFNKKEPNHHDVFQIYYNIRFSRGIIYTTDYILDEVYTLLFKRVSFETALKSVDTVSKAIDDGYLNLIWITPERFQAAKKMRIKFKDKPDISFTDITTMVAMQEFKICEIITGDAHFTHVGMGFGLLP